MERDHFTPFGAKVRPLTEIRLAAAPASRFYFMAAATPVLWVLIALLTAHLMFAVPSALVHLDRQYAMAERR